MSFKTKQFTINGVDYEVTSLGALKGRKIWLKLAQVIASPLKDLQTLNRAKGNNEVAIVSLLASAVENLDEAMLEELYTAFGETCTVAMPGGKNPYLKDAVFDLHFATDYVSMMAWLWECVNFNFASFLGDMGIGSIGSLLRKAGAARLDSLKGSTGSSGES